MVYVKKNHFLVVSSKDRNVTSYPSSSNFVINLNNQFKSIQRIELLHATIPDKGSVQNQPYLVLNIKELQTNTLQSNDTTIQKSFALLHPTIPVASNTFMQIDSKLFEMSYLEYTVTPRANLAKMSIQILNPSGSVFSFGGDGTLDTDYQCTFVFKITCLEQTTEQLDVKIV